LDRARLARLLYLSLQAARSGQRTVKMVGRCILGAAVAKRRAEMDGMVCGDPRALCQRSIFVNDIDVVNEDGLGKIRRGSE